MTFNPLTGINGSVKIGATSYAFNKWTLRMMNNLQKVNNFTGQGYQNVRPGVTSAELTLEGVYDAGNMPFAAGSAYTFTLGYSNSLSTQVTIYLESVEPAVDYDGNETLKITGQSDGAFTAAIT